MFFDSRPYACLILASLMYIILDYDMMMRGGKRLITRLCRGNTRRSVQTVIILTTVAA